MAAMTSFHEKARRPIQPYVKLRPRAYDVIGSLYTLQFLIHNTCVLVLLKWLPAVEFTIPKLYNSAGGGCFQQVTKGLC